MKRLNGRFWGVEKAYRTRVTKDANGLKHSHQPSSLVLPGV